MKAIRKTDGKVIEVSSLEYTNMETNVKSRYCAADGKMYPLSDLDFSVDEAKEAEGKVISGWVARDKDGEIYLYENKPERGFDEWLGRLSSKFDFQKITWSSEPIEVEITIKPKKK